MIHATPVFLCYHEIEYGVQTPNWKFSVSYDAFRSQLNFLSDHGYRFVTVDEHFNSSGFGEHQKHCIICFDDCYRGTVKAAELLAEYSGHATWYAISEATRPTSAFSLRNNLGHLKVQDLKSLQSLGHQIGSHSVSHPNLRALKPHQMRKEILNSKYELEDYLSHSVTSFCYPYGRYNRLAMDIVEECGYENAMALLRYPLMNGKAQYHIARSAILASDDRKAFAFKVKYPGHLLSVFAPLYAKFAIS